MALSFEGRTGCEAREGSAMIAARIADEHNQRGRYAVRYKGAGHGWYVMVWTKLLSDPDGPPAWIVAAGPFTSRESAIAEAETRRDAEQEAIGGPGWSVKA